MRDLILRRQVGGPERSMKNSLKVRSSIYYCFKLQLIALYLYNRDWKRVEMHIGTRSGAQIRSHAQKFLTRVEKEVPGVDFQAYINQKA
jgi:hypothetical protein